MSSILDNYTVSYAQNREDLIVKSFFPDIKDGFFIDVGANHPERHSVTKIFYDEGWRGINIEPNPAMYDLVEQYRSNDINLNIGISNKSGELKLRLYHSSDGLAGLSTFSSSIKENYSNNTTNETKNFSDITVKVKTLKEVFIENKTKIINFMKVDVEGFEYEVLEGNDWDKFRPQLICIEANHLVKDWHKFLHSKNYEVVFNDGLNDYLLSKEAMDRLKYFDYAKTMLLDKQVINSDLAGVLYEKEKKLEYFEFENQKNINELARLENDYNNVVNQRNELHWTLMQYSSPLKLLKIVAIKVNRRIRFYINKLQQPRHKHRAPELKIGNLKKTDTDELLRLAHNYDQSNLVQVNFYFSPRYYLYIVLSTAYYLMRKIVKMIYKGLKYLRGLRKKI